MCLQRAFCLKRCERELFALAGIVNTRTNTWSGRGIVVAFLSGHGLFPRSREFIPFVVFGEVLTVRRWLGGVTSRLNLEDVWNSLLKELSEEDRARRFCQDQISEKFRTGMMRIFVDTFVRITDWNESYATERLRFPFCIFVQYIQISRSPRERTWRFQHNLLNFKFCIILIFIIQIKCKRKKNIENSWSEWDLQEICCCSVGKTVLQITQISALYQSQVNNQLMIQLMICNLDLIGKNQVYRSKDRMSQTNIRRV